MNLVLRSVSAGGYGTIFGANLKNIINFAVCYSETRHQLESNELSFSEN